MRTNYMTYGMAAKLALGTTVALFIFFFLLSSYFRNLLNTPDGAVLPTQKLIPMILFGPISQFLLLFGLFSINFRILSGKLAQKRKIVFTIAASILFAITYSTVASILRGVLFHAGMPKPEHVPVPFFVSGMVKDLFLVIFVISISQILYLTQKHRQVERRNDQLEAENLRTRYEALKNQVNPHFLFNTLSTLDAMIAIDPVRSRNYIQKFSSVFRYTLKNNDTVTLGNELDFVRNYADLMQIRHGDSLQIKFAIDQKYNNCLVVPMAVQSLVENAIKHNSFSASEPLVVTIETTPGPELTVSNQYRPREYPEAGEGVGLANLAGRYSLIWRREITVDNEDGIFRVSLPLIQPQP